MAYTRRWTPMEDRVLRHNVTICGDNITEACEKTAPLIGRTPKACCYRWYYKLAKEVDSGMNFSLIGVEKEIKNKKNKLRKNNNKKNKKKTNFIKRLLNKLFS